MRITVSEGVYIEWNDHKATCSGSEEEAEKITDFIIRYSTSTVDVSSLGEQSEINYYYFFFFGHVLLSDQSHPNPTTTTEVKDTTRQPAFNNSN